MTEEEILAAAKRLHDQRHGETHCDVRYLRSCPRFAQAVLDAGRAARETPAVEVVASGRVNMAERFAQRPVSLQHDACGARLTVHNADHVYPRTMTWVCVLGPHGPNDKHRAADGTQWRATDFPPTAPTGPDATIRSAVAGISTQIDSMTAVFAELREAVDSGQLNAIRALLRDAGLGYAPPADDVADLVRQRDGHLEHVTEIRDAVKGAIYGTVHHGHSPTLDECEHHVCVALRRALNA